MVASLFLFSSNGAKSRGGGVEPKPSEGSKPSILPLNYPLFNIKSDNTINF